MLKGLQRVLDYTGYYLNDIPTKVLTEEYNIKYFKLEWHDPNKIPIASVGRGLELDIFSTSDDTPETKKFIKNFVPTEDVLIYVFKECVDPLWVKNQNYPESEIFFDDAFLTTYNRHLYNE